MKFRMVLIILALTTLSWAQTTAPSKPNEKLSSTSAVPAAGKADCPCCQKMTEGKATESCCAHHQDGAAKSEMPCCKGKEGKDAMSCMKGDKDKSTDAASSKGNCCGGDGKACCSKSDKTTEQAAMACCGANGEHCGMVHHDHADINK